MMRAIDCRMTGLCLILLAAWSWWSCGAVTASDGPHMASDEPPSSAQATARPGADQDPRSFQHGLDVVQCPDGRVYVFWSSSGVPPAGSPVGGSWSHDVYYSDVDPANPAIHPRLLIAAPEAQEPVSAAVSDDGTILLTMEDGWDAGRVVAQRYGVYDASLRPVSPYPQTILDGGHSGHAAASGNAFVVAYSEGWIDGGGVEELGSGDDVHVSLHRVDGAVRRRLPVAVGPARDWWPLVAGLPETALVVWQRYREGDTFSDVMMRPLDPKRGTFTLPATRLAERAQYYTYSVGAMPSLRRFVVLVAFDSGDGAAYLVNDEGAVLSELRGLPAIVREAQPVIWHGTESARIVHAAQTEKIVAFSVSPSALALEGVMPSGVAWQTMGVDGLFLDANRVWLVGLTTTGLVDRLYDLRQ